MKRILSLLPSTTEIAAALGLAHCLVGRSHECDIPASVTTLPIVTEAKLDLEASSSAIDRRVKELVRDGLSVYRVDTDLVLALRPETILTQTQCEVCAVTPGDLREALARFLGEAPELVAVEPNTLDDVLEDFARVAAGCGVAERGIGLRDRERARIETLTRERAGRPAATVAVLEWIDPVMGCGNWIPELVERAGGVSVLGDAGEHAAWSTLEDLARLDPDHLVIAPCGFSLPRTRRELPALTGDPAWPTLRAVREGRVALVDGFRHMNRPGARIVESLEILVEILHPERFAFGHGGISWTPLNTGSAR